MKNMDPNLYSLSAVVIGYLLTDDLNASEIASLGNWLELIGQYLETVSSQQTLIENNLQNININTNSKKAKNGQGHFEKVDNSNQVLREEIELLKKSLNKINTIINEIKNK